MPEFQRPLVGRAPSVKGPTANNAHNSLGPSDAYMHQ